MGRNEEGKEKGARRVKKKSEASERGSKWEEGERREEGVPPPPARARVCSLRLRPPLSPPLPLTVHSSSSRAKSIDRIGEEGDSAQMGREASDIDHPQRD